MVRMHAGPNLTLNRTEMSFSRTYMDTSLLYIRNQTTRTVANWDQTKLDLCGVLSPCITITIMENLMKWNDYEAFVFIFLLCLSPMGTLGVLDKNMSSVSPCATSKATEIGRCLGITVKRLAPCRCLGGHIKEPYEISMALGAWP